MIKIDNKPNSNIQTTRLKSILSLCIILLASGNSSLCASDTPDANIREKGNANEFSLPPRKNESENPVSGTDLKSILGDTGIKVGIVIGILSIAVIILAKRKDNSSIPREAIEILGSVPMSSRQSVQLIRFGQKLVLVESASTGLKPISEITDPTEVDRMLDLIRTKVR